MAAASLAAAGAAALEGEGMVYIRAALVVLYAACVAGAAITARGKGM